MKVVHFKMNLFGEMKPATGLMSLGVHPLHKKKGVALSMVKKFEDISKESGALVSALLPFNSGFYRSMGYGYGSKLDEYNIPTEALPSFDMSASKLDLRLLTIKDVPGMLEFYSEYVKRNHGAMDKFSEEKRIMERDHEPFRVGCFDGEKMVGYISYTIRPDNDVNYTLNAMSVDELIYSDAEVLKALLSFLNMQKDLAQHVIVRTGEEDFYHILRSIEDTSGNYINFGYLQTNISAIGNMYKILSPMKFIEELSHRKFMEGNASAVFKYKESLSGKKKALKIDISEGSWRASEYEEGSADEAIAKGNNIIEISEDNLSSLLMGSCRLSSLMRMGAAKVSSVDEAEKLSYLLTPSQKPFSNNDY